MLTDTWSLTTDTLGTASIYGTPCTGSVGPLALQVQNNSRPLLGQTFDLRMTGVPTFSPCLGFVGFSRTALGTTPLPVLLDNLNVFGCYAYQSADLSFSLGIPNNTTQTTAWSLAIPNDPIFLAMHIYLQGLALEFGGARFATVTDAIDARIGNR